MGTYRSNIAPKSVGSTGAVPAPGQSAKFRNVSTAPNAGTNVGNQLQVQANDKGTGVAGRPSSIGLASKDWSAPATENPSGSGNKTTAKYR